MSHAGGPLGRREFLARAAGTAAALAGGAVLAGCSSGTTPAAGSHKSPYGGSLLMATSSEENSLSPPQAHWDSAGYLYANTIFDTLTAIGADGKTHPYLAESVTPNADYTQWTVKLRTGVHFHDGTLCDGAAVKGSLDAIRESLITGSAVGPMTGTKLLDAGTVLIELDQPWVPFDSYLSSQLGYIAAPAMLRSPNQGGSKPIGTGPFVFQEWDPGDHLTATRNPHYWQKGYPYLDQITFRPVADPGSCSEALRSGAAQLMHTNYALSIRSFLGDSSYRVVEGTLPAGAEPGVDFIMLNCAKPPTDDLTIRRALAMATNKQQLQATFGAGLTQTVSGPFQPGSVYYAPTPYPAFDPAGAKQLISAWTAQHGAPPAITLGSIPGPEYEDILAVVGGQWTAAGVKVSTAQYEQSSFLTDALFGQYEAITFEQFFATDPDQNYVWWSAATSGAKGGISLNLARNSDPLIQSALEKGRTSADSEARAEAYKQVADRLAIDLPYLWVSKALWAAISLPEVAGVAGQVLPDGTPGMGFVDGTFPVHELRLNGT